MSDGEDRQGESFVDEDFTGRNLRFVTFADCELAGCRLDEADLTGVRVIESRLTELDAAVLSAPRSEFRTVELRGSRLGSVELYEARWQSVLVTDSKLGYLNVRGAAWSDVEFRACSIDELDLSGASAARVAFVGCRIETLHLRDARMTDVDLRGAALHVIEGVGGLAGCSVSEEQLRQLAPLLADHLGLTVLAEER